MWTVLLCSCIVAVCVPAECRTIISRVSFGSGTPSEIYKLEQPEVVRTVRQNTFPPPPPFPVLPAFGNNTAVPIVTPTTYKPTAIGVNNFNQGLAANFNTNPGTNLNRLGTNSNNNNNGGSNYNTNGANPGLAGFNNNFNRNGLGNNFNQGGNNFNNGIGNQPDFNLNNRNSFGDNNDFSGGSDLGPIQYSYNGNGRGRDEIVMVSVPGGYGGESVKGSFSYKGSNGQKYVVMYTASSDGFNLQANKEKPPSASYPTQSQSSPGTSPQISTALLCSLQGTCI